MDTTWLTLNQLERQQWVTSVTPKWLFTKKHHSVPELQFAPSLQDEAESVIHGHNNKFHFISKLF